MKSGWAAIDAQSGSGRLKRWAYEPVQNLRFAFVGAPEGATKGSKTAMCRPFLAF
jgi:hypothetical protein